MVYVYLDIGSWRVAQYNDEEGKEEEAPPSLRGLAMFRPTEVSIRESECSR